MASLSLPPPRKSVPAPQLTSSEKPAAAIVVETKTTAANQNQNNMGSASATATTLPPSYEERCRAAAEVSKMSVEERRRTGKKLFVPRSLQDFGDGGAFPEIHVAQYPRHLGNPHLKRNNSGSGSGSGSRALVNVQVDKDGEISYDAIVKGGTNKDKLVYSRLDDLRGRTDEEKDVALPTAEQEQADTAKTAAALQALLDKNNKTALAKPTTGQANAAAVEEQTQFIKYTANPEAPGYNPAAAQRVIQMVPAQVDPMMPPKHKHLKAPAGPAEDPVPVLHAPPTKLSKEERDAWNIPACISNWKNMRGYTIPLDKRLAADGRGLREHSINPAFATLSESLYVAEQQARQEVRMRATVQKKLALQEKEQREEELRALAQQARLERGGGGGGAAAAVATSSSGATQQQHVSDHEEEHDNDERSFDESITRRPDVDSYDRKQEETEDQVAARQREKLRMERKREREKEMRMERNVELKKKKRMEEERDVSEKIALGVHTGTGGGLGGDVDARLYSQTGGMDSGFGREDEYNAYSKPLFERQAAVSSASIYRPTRGETEYNADEQYDKLVKGSTTKFQPDKGFAGAEGGMDMQAGARTAPVQFEKGQPSSSK